MFSGPTCQTEQAGDCGDKIYNTTEMTVNHAPELTQLRFLDNNLVIGIEGAFVQGRLETEVMIHDGSGDPLCRYPGPFWQKSLDHDDCKDVWASELPWQHAINCGWAETTTATVQKFASVIRIKHRELIGFQRELPIYRIAEHVYPIAITFQTEITVSTDITVYAPINLMAIISSQKYDPLTKIATIQVTTSLQYPFQIAFANLTNAPSGYVAELVEITNYEQTCTGDLDVSCLQIYTLDIDAALLCTVTGLYRIDVEFACNQNHMIMNEGQCPLSFSGSDGYLVLDVTSQDFCGEVSLDVGLRGVLYAFQHNPENPYSTIRSNFLIGSEVAFVAELEPDKEGIELVKTTILQVYVTHEGGSPFLYDKQLKPGGVAVDFRILEEHDYWAAFYVKLLPPTFYVLTDRSKRFTVYCRLEVEYAGMVKREVTVGFDYDTISDTEDGGVARQSNGQIPVPEGSTGTAEAGTEFYMLGKYENPEDDPFFTAVGPPHPEQDPDEWNSDANFGKPKDAASRIPSVLLHVANAVALRLCLLLATI